MYTLDCHRLNDLIPSIQVAVDSVDSCCAVGATSCRITVTIPELTSTDLNNLPNGPPTGVANLVELVNSALLNSRSAGWLTLESGIEAPTDMAAASSWHVSMLAVSLLVLMVHLAV
jgi:hypothetical protein